MAFGNIDLTRELVQAVRDAVDVIDVANEHTKLTRKGRDYEGLCPFHKEKTPSFHVDPDKGLYYCFGCGAGGDAIKLHMETTGDDFPAAIESLALRYGIPVQQRSRQRRPDEPDVEAALAAAEEFFHDQLGRHAKPQNYLRERKITPELAERFRVGYAPDGWTGLCDALGSRVKERDLVAAGLAFRSREKNNLLDKFRDRLMFPIHNPSGRLVGFGGRTLGDDKAKYINSAETSSFHKGQLLYGLFQGRREIRDLGRAVLVEGYFDVLGTVAAGVEGAVATMGTALTPEQARLVARYAEEVVVAYDGDKAGETAHQRALPVLLAHGLAVHRARFPDGHDPDSLRLEAGPQAVVKAVADAPDAVIEEIERQAPPAVRDEPRSQAKAASDLGELLGRIPDGVLRFTYGRRAAEALDLPVELVLQKMPRAKGKGGGKHGGPGGQQGARPGKGAAFRPVGGSSGPGGPPPGPPPEGPSGGPYDAGPAGGDDPRFAPPGGAGGDPGAATGRTTSPVRTLEEHALELLLTGDGVPAVEELPVEEVFLDPQCRNIYRVFYDLYQQNGGSQPPRPKEVLAALGEGGAAVDRIARLMMEGDAFDETHASTSRGPAVGESLDKLTRRWWQQRQRVLSRDIAEAQRQGDGARLERLLKEKTELSQRLHRLA